MGCWSVTVLEHTGAVQTLEGVDVCRAVDQVMSYSEEPENGLIWRQSQKCITKFLFKASIVAVTSLQIALEVRCTNVTPWHVTHKTDSVFVLGMGQRFFSSLCSKVNRYHK